MIHIGQSRHFLCDALVGNSLLLGADRREAGTKFDNIASEGNLSVPLLVATLMQEAIFCVPQMLTGNGGIKG
jgi:hypothetical protein